MDEVSNKELQKVSKDLGLLGFSNGYLLSSQFKLEFSDAVKSWTVMESFSSGNKLESLLESSRRKKAKNMGM